jgi:hypothetical protein
MNTPNLDTIRDEKCLPIAKTILKEMVTDLMKEEGPKDVALKALSLELNNDINIITDVPYIPQLIMTTLAALNATVQTCDFKPLNEDYYITIAEKVLEIVASSDVKMNLTPDEIPTQFAGVKTQLSSLFVQENLNMFEVKHIMDKILEKFGSFNILLSNSIENSSERAEAKLWKVESMNDVTMKQLNEVLVSDKV